MTRVAPHWRSLGACAVVGLSCVSHQTARAQAGTQRLSADLLQTLGVGSRSIAMGNAFSAIANDTSATFWNPARLPLIPGREFMIEFRPVINSNSFSDGTNLTAGNGPGKPQLGFAGLVIPLGYTASIGISYTLGGYFSNQLISNIPTIDALGNPTFERRRDTLLVRNSFLTVAYGKRNTVAFGKDKKANKILNGNVYLGLGVFFANQDFTSINAAQTTSNLNAVLPVTNFDTERGQGVGVSFGVAVDPPGKRWSFGMTYRTKTNLSGLSDRGSGFNNEIPERFTIGTAYTLDHEDNRLILSLEAQRFGAANRRGGQIDARNAVTNIHFGAEWDRVGLLWNQKDKHFRTPLRMGFHTNANAASGYTYYDNVLSFGFAIQYEKPKKRTSSVAGFDFSLEPTVEILTHNGLAQYTLTGRIRY